MFEESGKGGRTHSVGTMDLVSVVIPSYNPGSTLLETIASARRQVHRRLEIILVNDGSDSAEGLASIRSAAPLVDAYIEQPNRGTGGARNAGFRAASGKYVLPLDCDDLLDPRFVSECLRALNAHPEAAFAYTDCHVFGRQRYLESYGEYNLYALLDRNPLPYAVLVRKEAWAAAGGYDEDMKLGNEDWEFFLRLGAGGCYGHHVAKVLFHYRKHGPSLSDIAAKHERHAREYMRRSHPELYSYEARARLKAAWQPAACIVGAAGKQTILDCEMREVAPPSEIVRNSRAQAFVISSRLASPTAAEFAALAIWAGAVYITLPDGSLAVSREAMAEAGSIQELSAQCKRRPTLIPDSSPYAFRGLARLYRHLYNAGLLSVRVWLTHPLRSALRLVPLRVKEAINRWIGRTVFDLSFYLQFQPASVMLCNRLLEPLAYIPARPDASRRRVALITPHLGPGGAERVLLNVAASLDRTQFEIFLIATHSRDSLWREKWEKRVDHVYDLAALAALESVPGALYSIARNWQFEKLLIQNSLPAYAIARELKADLPGLKVMDLIHSTDAEWDIVSSTEAVAGCMDVRIAISEAVRARLLRAGTPSAAIRLIRNGIDLDGRPVARTAKSVHQILFAGRLDPVKRPLMLVDIAIALRQLRPESAFRILVAGDGPESGPLRERVRRAGVSDFFQCLGHVPDITPFLENVDLLVLTSRTEGIPLVVLEAFAAGRPVVASNVGAVAEVVDTDTGFIIEPSGMESEVKAFARAIHALLESPELRERMGRNARVKVETEYNIDKFWQEYRNLFEL
jgi:glycosyltransferase involved in cell wall biosynthesis/GT2 family glycosyltransferase